MLIAKNHSFFVTKYALIFFLRMINVYTVLLEYLIILARWGTMVLEPGSFGIVFCGDWGVYETTSYPTKLGMKL